MWTGAERGSPLARYLDTSGQFWGLYHDPLIAYIDTSASFRGKQFLLLQPHFLPREYITMLPKPNRSPGTAYSDYPIDHVGNHSEMTTHGTPSRFSLVLEGLEGYRAHVKVCNANRVHFTGSNEHARTRYFYYQMNRCHNLEIMSQEITSSADSRSAIHQHCARVA